MRLPDDRAPDICHQLLLQGMHDSCLLHQQCGADVLPYGVAACVPHMSRKAPAGSQRRWPLQQLSESHSENTNVGNAGSMQHESAHLFCISCSSTAAKADTHLWRTAAGTAADGYASRAVSSSPGTKLRTQPCSGPHKAVPVSAAFCSTMTASSSQAGLCCTGLS